MKIRNPYNYKGEFLKGNLHTHSKNSPCGYYRVDKVIEMYTSYKMEYDFLSITDHFSLTDVSKFKDREDIIVIPGVEYKRKNHQTLGINIKEYDDDLDNDNNHQQLFNKVTSMGGINIICHPHVERDDYWTLEELLKLDNYTGIEIFNNNVRMDCKGRAVATDLWDELLSSGKYVFGFANDDMHIFSRVGGAYNMVLCQEKTTESIINSIKRGSFYASFGMILKDIKLNNNTISLKNGDERVPYIYFKFIGKNGVTLKEEKGNVGTYEIQGNEGYVRVETYREDGARAWLQPFIIEC
ncbi:hypothetical protein ACFO6R_03420 [Eubacterium multiforme]|uniref:Polymerase/histidinol phosphatase N-terminal domain-containing protein n=1 Tax=Eubacterium multiforme TaxID=83339 RepID=A0ABT9UNH7_9FIRM|nr:hypothetical protein [Eubacterium multiforme]MDQ0148192.1 hypothetical protein [Eubacterium multiforme]